MNLLQALLFRAQHLADAEVLSGMGYTTADEAALGHLKSIRARAPTSAWRVTIGI